MNFAGAEGAQHPAILSDATRKDIDELRAFRHVIRNIYGTNLNEQRMDELAQKSIQVGIQFKSDWEVFKKAMLPFQSPEEVSSHKPPKL